MDKKERFLRKVVSFALIVPSLILVGAMTHWSVGAAVFCAIWAHEIDKHRWG